MKYFNCFHFLMGCKFFSVSTVCPVLLVYWIFVKVSILLRNSFICVNGSAGVLLCQSFMLSSLAIVILFFIKISTTEPKSVHISITFRFKNCAFSFIWNLDFAQSQKFLIELTSWFLISSLLFQLRNFVSLSFIDSCYKTKNKWLVIDFFK